LAKLLKDEWVVAADRDSGLTIVRSGYATAGEANAARREIEARMADDDTTNHLLLTRAQADKLIAEERELKKVTRG